MYFHRYRIRVWDEYFGDITNEEGLIIGESFSDAVERLEKYYGKDNIEEIFLSDITDESGEACRDILPLNVICNMLIDRTNKALEKIKE